MKKGKKLYEGKAKILYDAPEKGAAIQHFKDHATAFNNQKKATIEGNALPATVVPSAAGIRVGLPPCITAAAELLVPRSIPIIFSVIFHYSLHFFLIQLLLMVL